MKRVDELTPDEAVEFIRAVKRILFMEPEEGVEFWNPDKELDSNHVSALVELMDDYDLIPEPGQDHGRWWSVGHGADDERGIVRANSEDEAIDRWRAHIARAGGFSKQSDYYWATQTTDTDITVLP